MTARFSAGYISFAVAQVSEGGRVIEVQAAAGVVCKDQGTYGCWLKLLYVHPASTFNSTTARLLAGYLSFAMTQVPEGGRSIEV